MTPRQQIDEIFNQVAVDLNFSDFKLDDTGYCSLTFDDKYVVSIEYFEEDETIFLYGPIGIIKDKSFEERLRIMTSVLSANFFWKDTNGATVSLETDTDTLVLAKKLEVTGLDKTIFKSNLEDFVNALEKWQPIIKGDVVEESSAPGRMKTESAPSGFDDTAGIRV